MKDLILQLEIADVDSILDVGLSKFVHREKYRLFAKENKIEVKTYFLKILWKKRKEPILKRNFESSVTCEFEVSENNFEFIESSFEMLT